jgi:hypothetical protein
LHIDTVVLRRIYALIVVEHGSRHVHLAGITDHPSQTWTVQACRDMQRLRGGLGGPTSDQQFIAPAHRTDLCLGTELGGWVSRRGQRAVGSNHDHDARHRSPQPVEKGRAPGCK